MSWPEFYYATQGYFDELRQKLGIEKERDMSAPSDETRRRVKEATRHLWNRKPKAQA